ncbi:DUF4269 domain-containing protein [Halobacillus sp. BBL2006]|uniref:DUF4269 domain-containing protein n=1 Tax=Halobacillus sp. BBL2006 TaxID=1543706 RepID=UPI000542B0B3|nr:DUF4269 domain-containing protein [Halobacillus sp. BBL2006]KHE73205.1 alpha/beta hydrolase [Halobacillus sp. BBL2006]
MKTGTKKQQDAYRAIMELDILNDLGRYTPVLCGTVPLGIDTCESDLDIIMEIYNFKPFVEKLVTLYQNKKHFTIKRKEIGGKKAVKANFHYKGFEFELFGQGEPVHKQHAYLHMVIEYELLQKSPHLQEKVITLKKQGYKTEHAFCKLLNIQGDPYKGLIRYGQEKGLL